MENLQNKLKDAAMGGRLSCPNAFRIAEEFGLSPLEVGREATRMGIKIFRCQLGLFGYEDLGSKSIVKPMDNVSPVLKQAIESRLVSGKLPCSAAWEIAAQLKIGKIQVAGAADALGVKITACQLGCFK